MAQDNSYLQIKPHLIFSFKLPMSKVDQSYLGFDEVTPLQWPNSLIIPSVTLPKITDLIKEIFFFQKML